MPGEWIPDDLPTGTFIFVEEGFLVLTCYRNNRWKCTNVYAEGTLTGTYSEGAPEMEEGSYRVRATEPSRIYYLASEDKCRVEKIFPNYIIAHMRLEQRSTRKHYQRARLLHLPPPDRVINTELHFRYLYRAPLQDLTQFLGLEDDKVGKVVLEAFHEKFRSTKHLAQQHN